ncbi:MAG: type III-B CRISPR module RAMP protein Cmr6 [Thermoanaerobacteraceae bacterium]|nr:type III-B CRISPR module RAMP protein Cmr6 [Thermoanaerobacteraceae bacterium]
MKTERIKVLQFRKEKYKGIILGDNLKEYVISLKEVPTAIINQLERGTEIEFVVPDDKKTSHVKDLKIIARVDQGNAEKPRQDSHKKNKARGYGRDEGKNIGINEKETTGNPYPKYLPKDTQEIIEKGGASEISNYHLMLNRYPLFQNNKFLFYKVDTRSREFLYNYNHDFSQLNFKDLAIRKEETIKGLGLLTENIVMEPEWRMVVGLGGASVYETSMTLHHTYGIPYIPGSFIKGTIRSWIITNCFAGQESEALKDKGFELIFGSQSKKGKVYFYDAFPQDKPTLMVDIMTPHYSNYYSKGKPPGDYDSPNPIPFITVEKTKFNFLIGIEPKENETIDQGYFQGKQVLDVVKTWIKKTLLEHGIGAKTAVGYGIMKE